MNALPGLLIPLLACSSCFTVDLAKDPPEKKRFLFSVTMPAADGTVTAVRPVLSVEQVNALAPYNARPFVTRTGENEYSQDYYHEFLISPATQLAQITRAWLRATRAYPTVVDSTSDPIPANAILTMDLLELRGDYRVAGRPIARLVIRASLVQVVAGLDSPRIALQKNYAADITLADRSPETLVAGWSVAIAQVLAELNTDLHRVGRSGR